MAQRGLDSFQEQNQQQIIRDTRTLGQKSLAYLRNSHGVALTMLGYALFSFFFRIAADVVLLIALFHFVIFITAKNKLPFRMPESSGKKDNNNGKRAEGIYFLGNEKKTQDEIWFDNGDMRTHALIFGSTGSGKTEALVSMAYNALVQSSGFIYVDGKGDNSLFAKIFSMCRSMGREDDLLLINFMTGARDIVGPQEKRLSNTLNPFCSGSSSMLSNLIVSLMESSSQGSSDGDMWKGRAISFVEAIMRVLVAARDRGDILLDAHTIRNYFVLNRLEALVLDKILIRDNQEPVSIEDFPETILDPIKMYLYNLPGYNKDKKGQQVSQVLEQHGFITMQLTRAFSSLADTYGHILRTNLAEVDLKDVVLNRRILVVLLPALEKSPAELSNLGKIIIATLKCMMAAGLGDSVEGRHKDLIESKPTNSKTPYLCILDEYGYYAVEGFAVVPAQARSLGFSVVFAGQDYPAFQKASKEEAASIGANTNIKMCMKLEDPTETYDFFNKTAGEAYAAHVESFNVSKSLLNNYQDTRSARLEKRSRIDLLDLKEQDPGEMHIFFRSKVVRAKVFYADPKPVEMMRINHFLKIEPPTDEFVESMQKSVANLENKLEHGLPQFGGQTHNEDFVKGFTQHLKQDDSLPLIDRMIAALLPDGSEVHVDEVKAVIERLHNEDPSLLNVFSGMNYTPYYDGVLAGANKEQILQPLLDKQCVVEDISLLERMVGRSTSKSAAIADELVSDMRKGSLYDFDAADSMPQSTDLENLVRKVIQDISNAKQEAKKDTKKD